MSDVSFHWYRTNVNVEAWGINVLWIHSSMIPELCPLCTWNGGHQCPMDSFFYDSRVMPLVYLYLKWWTSMSYGFILLWFQSYAPCLLVLEARVINVFENEKIWKYLLRSYNPDWNRLYFPDQRIIHRIILVTKGSRTMSG